LLISLGQRNALLFLLIVAVMSLFDVVGITIIFPFLQIVMQPDASGKVTNFFWAGFIDYLTYRQQIISMGLGLIFFYACKAYIQSINCKLKELGV
jgi:hypothetical protein